MFAGSASHNQTERQNMRIVSLTSENFMRLVAVELTPSKDGLVLITGKNGMGKSSVLDAIYTTLGGGKIAPDKPIRDGEERAETTIVTENYRITRTFTEKGSKLVIKNADGIEASSPQKLLDKIVGDISFDPMKFIAMGDTEAGKRNQRIALMKLAGLDFADLNTKIANLKADRSDVRKDKERLEHEAGRITIPDPELPDELIEMADLVGRLNVANAHNSAIKDKKVEVSEMETSIKNLGQQAANWKEKSSGIKDEIAGLEEQLLECEQMLKATEEVKLSEVSDLAALVESIKPPIDTEEITQEMGKVEATNEQIKQREQKADLTKQSEAKADLYRKYGLSMKAFESEKATRLAKATMPLEGLSVTDDCVVFEGIPLSQVNGAKQLEVGLGIAMAQNPELKVILMEGNNLDEDSLAVISKMTADKGFQVWVERIKGKGGIVIEDGMVQTAEMRNIAHAKANTAEVEREREERAAGDILVEHDE